MYYAAQAVVPLRVVNAFSTPNLNDGPSPVLVVLQKLS